MSLTSLMIAASILSPGYLALLRKGLPGRVSLGWCISWLVAAATSCVFFLGLAGKIASALLVNHQPEMAAGLFLASDQLYRLSSLSLPIMLLVLWFWRIARGRLAKGM